MNYPFIVFILCLIPHGYLKSQNLVPNSSFEEFVDFSSNKSIGWHKVQTSDTPDYFNFSNSDPYNNIYNKYMGNINPKNGDGFIGIFCYRVSTTRGIQNIREYVESRLLQALDKDSLYKIELSLRLDIESNIAIRNFGVYFSNSLCSKNKKFRPFSIKPQVEFNSVMLDSTNTWVTLQALYKADGSERYIVLGNFKSDNRTSKRDIFFRKEKGKRYKWDLVDNEKASYYYIDDVIVNKIPFIKKQPLIIEEDVEIQIPDSLYNIDEIEIDSAIILKNIIFEFNKSDLMPRSYVELKRLEQLLKNNPDIRIKLEGHTDNIGGYDFNLNLSIKRVETVAEYLISKGISPSRIEYAGYSYAQPLASNDTEEGRQINRRVVFRIISK